VQDPADAIDYLSRRIKKGLPSGSGNAKLDLSNWTPLLKQLLRNPHRSGPLANALIAQLGNYMNAPAAANVRIADENAIQRAVGISVDGS
jgi:hypothetical protein